MPILYDVPRIGEKRSFGQQGPTCWYYAAKMLIKFHEMHKNPATSLQIKPFHELRKALSEMLLHKEREDPAAVQKYMQESMVKIDALMKKQDANINTLMAKDAVAFKSNIDNLKALKAKNDTRIPNIEAAIKILDKNLEDEMDRTKLIKTFVNDPNIDFKEWEFDWSKGGDIEDRLTKWGPFYTGGSLSSVSARRKDTGAKSKEGGDSIIAVEELNVGSAHAVVIAGIKNDTLYYKDPTGTDEVRSILLTNFAKGAKKSIVVNCFYGREGGGCVHQRSRALAVP